MATAAQGASIALFMLLAAVIAPDPPPGGVGLHGAARPVLRVAALAGDAGGPARVEAQTRTAGAGAARPPTLGASCPAPPPAAAPLERPE